MRRIFVGDVQGCRVELERLLEALDFDPAADEVHPVGDLVNRGPDSLGTLRLARDLDFGGVLGNHDLHLLHAAVGLREPGKRDTLAEVLDASDRRELLDWLAARPFVRAWDDLYLVHAGLNPRWKDPVRQLAGADPMAPDEDALFACRVRYCDPEGNLSEEDRTTPPAPFQPWDAFYDPRQHGRRRVVFGHWSMRGLVQSDSVLGLDTGCVWGRQLSAWIAEEDRLVQIPAERAYCSF